jgi:hypothetical protein
MYLMQFHTHVILVAFRILRARRYPAFHFTALPLHVAWAACPLDSYDMIYLLTAVGLTPGGSSTVHIYTQTIRRTTQLTRTTTQLTTEQHKNVSSSHLRRPPVRSRSNLEDGGSRYFRNVCLNLPMYTVSNPKRLSSAKYPS